jgi:hypothetical protein
VTAMRALAVLLVMLVGMFLATFVRAEECHKPNDTIAQLAQFTETNKTGAVATYVDLPGENGQLGVLIIVFDDHLTMGSMELYQKGCRINNPSTGEVRTGIPIDPKMRSLMDEAGAVLFDNHGKWPVAGSWPS